MKYWVPMNLFNAAHPDDGLRLVAAAMASDAASSLGLEVGSDAWHTIYEKFVEHAGQLGVSSSAQSDSSNVTQLIDIIDNLEKSTDLDRVFSSNPVLYDRMGSLIEKLLGDK